MLLSYQGKDMTPQDALKACGVNKVFILLGMNDIALFGQESIPIAMENWQTVIDNIRRENPELQIYIQSGTPIYTGGQIGGLNNQRMDEYNARLQVFAEENGCIYLDVGTAMKDETNGLAYSYASDNYVHLTKSACELWALQLKNYVGQ
jgi:lysophospholipase L1-like esterase